MNGEEAIVHFGGDEVALRSEEFESDQGGSDGGDEKIENYGIEIEKSDSFVIGGEEPGGEGAATFGEIGFGLARHRGWR